MEPAKLETLGNDIVRPGIEKHLVPIALYRGGTSLGQVHRKWNFAISMMHTGVEQFGEAVKLSNNNEFSHLCEPHTRIQYRTMYSFFSRLKDKPAVTDNIPGLTKYVRSMLPDNKGWELIEVPLIDNNRASRVPWRIWRDEKPRGRPKGLIVPRESLFYPYVIHKPKVQDEAYDLMVLVNAAVPKMLPDHIRADICQDLIVDILAGDISVEEIKHNVKDYSRKVIEMHPLKYGHLSLDSPVGDGSATLADVLGV